MKISMSFLSFGALVASVFLSCAFAQPALPAGSRQQAFAWIKAQLNGQEQKTFSGTSAKGEPCTLYLTDKSLDGIEYYAVAVGSRDQFIGLFTPEGNAAGSNDLLLFMAHASWGNDTRFNRVSIVLKDQKPIRVHGSTDQPDRDIECSIDQK